MEKMQSIPELLKYLVHEVILEFQFHYLDSMISRAHMDWKVMV